MKLHQILTGAANTIDNSASVAYGCVDDYPFIVYISGCEVVILDGRFQRVQIIISQCAATNHVGLISCSQIDGKIAVAYGNWTRIFGARASGDQLNESLPFQWFLTSELFTNYTQHCLSWDRDGQRLLTGGEVLEMWVESEQSTAQNVTWKSVWRCEIPHPAFCIQFSSDGSYFATCGKNDCLVKIWFEVEKESEGSNAGMAYYDFLYIPHPRPVTRLSWRKTSYLMQRNVVANVLLTSCADNICRLWCETIEERSISSPLEPSHSERRRLIPNSSADATSGGDPYDIQTKYHFHIAASIDPSKDIPVMSTVSFFSSAENHSSFVLHWVNNKEMYITAVAKLLLGSPTVVVDVDADNAISGESGNMYTHSPYVDLTKDESVGRDVNDGEVSLEGLSTNSKDLPKDRSSVGGNNFLAQFDCLLRDWRNTPDSLLAINPADGSLLMFLVDSLDTTLDADFRQAQISFSSCIPDVFPPADAHSLLQNVILYRLPDKLSIQSVSNSEHPHLHGRYVKTSIVNKTSLKTSLVLVETGAHPPVSMITTHKDGSMNQWQIDFADNSAFSTLISLSHVTRLSGHRFPLTGLFPHPSLPILLSVSTFTAKVEEPSTLNDQDGDEDSTGSPRAFPWRKLEKRFTFTEFILWQCDCVFQLSQSGGIMELAKLTSTSPCAFDKIAWLPKLFVRPLLTFDYSVPVSAKSVAPCACFVAPDETGLLFYKVVLDGRALLEFLSGKQNRRADRMANFNSDEEGDEFSIDYPSVSTVNHLVDCIISDQSGPRPGSILRLCRLRRSRDVLKNPLFFHVFTEDAIGKCRSSDGITSTRDDLLEDTFYLVALDNKQLSSSDLQRTSRHEGEIRTMVHMWRIKITTIDKEDDESSGEMSFTPQDPLPTFSFTDIKENVNCGIRSRKVLTSCLDLPAGVYVTMATPSANCLSSVSENRVGCLPFLISTSCSDGEIRFWSCRAWDSSEGTSTRYSWGECSMKCPGTSARDQSKRGNTDGVPVAIDCANTGRVAIVTRPEPAENSEIIQGKYDVVIWESESNGNTEWIVEDAFDIQNAVAKRTAETIKHASVRWFSCENGLFVLAVRVGRFIHLYSLVESLDEEPSLKKRSPKHRYNRITTFEIGSPSTPSDCELFISFVRRGLLVVGIGNEVHVYSQWNGNISGDAKLIVSADDFRNPGLFNEVRLRNPTLPQYHPKYLIELLDFGKLRRARAILNHLVRCIAGEQATQAAVYSNDDTSRKRTRSVIGALNLGTYYSSGQGETSVRASDLSRHQYNVDCIPPLPIFKLLAADKDDSGNTNMDKTNADSNSSSDRVEETDYSELFNTSFKSSFDDSGIIDNPPVLQNSRSTSFSPVHFGVGQARLLSEHLSRKQLAGLTRIEQLELQALADTLATTKNDLEEDNSEAEQGLTFVKKCDLAKEGVTGFMGGPSGGGGGYATTGSVGVTEGSGGDAVDECGLRFLLAMRHHTCLLRSLPLVPRAQLEHQGLSSSKFIWAFHSDTQEELLAMLPGMIRGEPTWNELRQYGVGWWIKSNETLKRLVEKVAKTKFNENQDPMDCSLFYMAMKKKTVLRGLFRTQGNSRMATFFGNNFSEDRWRKAALKNAYSLLSKQRFEHAVAFFLLADALWDAVRLCISHLKDIQLALVVARLYDADAELPTYKRVLKEYVLGQAISGCEAEKDPFLRSIAYWLTKNYHEALRTLLLDSDICEADDEYNEYAASGSPDIFNFYMYLRTHPVLRRTQFEKHTKSNTRRKQRNAFKVTRQQSVSEVVMLTSPLTAFERQLYYMTAQHHYNTGCPDLSLQVLLDLPPPENDPVTKTDGSSVSSEFEERSTDRNETMINTGTLNVDWGKPLTSSNSAHDRSQSSSGQPHENGQSSSDFDWSQPSSGPDKISFDWSKPISGVLNGYDETDTDRSLPLSRTGDDNTSSKQNDDNKVSNELNGEDSPDARAKSGTLHVKKHEAITQRLKFRACLKLVVDELCSLPHHCEINNKDLRSTFQSWLKKEVDLIHKICDIEQDYASFESLMSLIVTSPTSDRDSFGDLVSDSANDKNNFAKKVETSARHIEWLKQNQPLLNILLNYCTLHGASGGDVATMKLELLILIHEMEQQRHLMSPLYLTSAGSSIPPLILATMVSTFSLGASPFTYLSAMTQDILKYLTKLPGPPNPTQPLEMMSVLRRVTATLSACVFQSLMCGNCEVEQSIHNSENLRANDLFSSNKVRTPTSSPNKWPGVRLLRSLLITEAKDNATKLKVLLSEICVATFLSLLATAWNESDPKQLYCIISNSLTVDMWGIVFGGGCKVIKQSAPLNSADEDSRRQSLPISQSQGVDWAAKRRQWNYKLLPPKNVTNKTEKKVEDEEFLPPQMSLMDYFQRKPNEGTTTSSHYDSDMASSDSEDEEDGIVASRVKKKREKPRDHLDLNSFSWTLMNYAISASICLDLHRFLADVGLEVTDLPMVSPLLHSAVKMLDHWKQVFYDKLKKCDRPVGDYIPLHCVDQDDFPRGGPTLMKYKALIDPNNTPFRSTSSTAIPAKRLWHTLVTKEQLQKVFLDFAFPRNSLKTEQHAGVVDEERTDENEATVLYKDSEAINSFCVSKTMAMRVVVATMRDVHELDISNAMKMPRAFYVDEFISDSENRKSDQEEYTMVYTGTDTAKPVDHNLGISAQSGVASSVMFRRNVSGIKRLEEHPNLPYYLAGGHDGSLRIWELGHEHEIATYRESGKYQRVTKVHFSQHGGKFGVIDFGGQLSLHQCMNTSRTTAITTLKCHNKQGNDFAFLGSTSLLATAGYSSDGNNACLWDTLLPQASSLVHGFNCHESGSLCVAYVPCKRLLLSGGRKGDVCIFDLRQRQHMQTFTAHDSDVKSIAVDESGEFFVTGSLDGDIKVWSLHSHKELLSYPNEHGKSNYQLIKLGTQGVPRVSLQPGGQLFSCGGDGTLKFRQLPLTDLIVNSPF